MNRECLVRFKNVTLGYKRNQVLSDVDLCVNRGDFLSILGPNGAGKTTLLKSMLGLIKPMNGRIEHRPGVRFGYVPQHQGTDDVFPLTVRDVVSMGRYGLTGPLTRMHDRHLQPIAAALNHTGMFDMVDRLYRDLSGGQKQRTLIARALASEPDILVLDEPTSDMDLGSESAILELLNVLRRENGQTVVLVSHLLHVVANHSETIGIIVDGTMRVGSVEEILTSEKLGSIYGLDVRVSQVEGRKVVITSRD